MMIRGEVMKAFLTGAVMGGIGVYVACVPSTSDISAARAGFLEADDPPVDPWSFEGGMEDASARRLEDASDVPFLQNKTNTICGRWNTGDRVFATKYAIDLPQCYAECTKRARCNYFSIAFKGHMAGRCQGCEHGVTEDRANFVFFTIKRNDQELEQPPQTTSFSCDGSVTSVDLDTLVDGNQPYQLCTTKEGDDEPTCSDFRSEGQAKASIKLCVPSSSTSTSSTTATTSSSTTMSSTTATTTSSTSTSSTTATASSSTTMSSTTATTSSSTSMSSTTSTTSTSTSTNSTGVFMPKDKNELKQAVDKWLTQKQAALEAYGDISTWSTSKITDMNRLFLGECPDFNDDISGWDVSQVTDMDYMFYSCRVFNQDISAWDVSKVTTMQGMFMFSSDFNQDLSAWDVSKVTNMRAMFFLATAFNGNISTWDVSEVTDTDSMFYRANAFNQDISAWDVSKVTIMKSMFYSAFAFNQDISAWNVSKVTNMGSMFYLAKAFNEDISAWDVSKVTTMNQMFYSAFAFNQDISSWDVSSVMNMDFMFLGADRFLYVDVSVWSPTSLSSSPREFISSRSRPCNWGDWSSWGANVPQCY